MAGSHGAIEVLAEQFKVRNIAHEYLLKNSSRFSTVSNAPNANIDRIQVTRRTVTGPPPTVWFLMHGTLVKNIQRFDSRA